MEKRIKLDDILLEIGEFGAYQIFVVVLMSFPIIFNGMTVNEYVFSAGDLNYRCHIPECEGPPNDAIYEVDWFGNAIPRGRRCERFAPTDNDVDLPPAAGTCPANIFNTSAISTCQDYVYEETNTIVYDFNINCEAWKRTLVGTMRSFGTFLVLPMTAFISDRFGRKIALIINAFSRSIFGVIRSFSVSYEMYLITAFMESTFSGGTFSSAYVYGTELVGPKWRTLSGVLMSVMFAIGQTLCGMLVWAFPHWRTFTRIFYIPQAIVIVYVWILPESTRWLLSKGEYKEAEVILKRAARINGKDLSSKSFEMLAFSLAAPDTVKKSISWKDVIKQTIASKPILLRVLICPFLWFTGILVLYGLTINSVNLAGNRYVNFILMALVEIPGYFTAAYALNLFGRRNSLSMSFTMCALACIATPFVSKEIEWLQVVLSMTGKFFISMVITSLYIYTSELFPTPLRHSYLAYSSMVGRIGSTLAPQTPLLVPIWAQLPTVIFGGFSIVSSLLVLLMPETKGTTLPDTIEEAENLFKK